MAFKAILTLFLLIEFQFFNISESCNPNSNLNATTPVLASPATTPLVINSSTTDSPTKSPLQSRVTLTESSTPSSIQTQNNTLSPELTTTETDNESIESYEHIIVSGMPFDRGESHGRQTKDKIQKLISYYQQSPSMPSWSDCINLVRAHFVKALQLYYPNGLEEMKGIAFGANVTLDDILILNARHELVQWKRSQNGVGENETFKKSHYTENKCKNQTSEENQDLLLTTPASNSTSNRTRRGDQMVGIGTSAVALSSATKYAHILIGQNWDGDEMIFREDVAILLEVRPAPCEGIAPFVMLAEAGSLGILGLNSDGLGVVGTSLWSSRDHLGIRNGEISIPSLLLRRIFLESPTFTVGLQRVLSSPRYGSTNLIVATAQDEALSVELTPVDFFMNKLSLEKEYAAHGNHFKSSRFVAQSDIHDRSHEISSFFRDRRVQRHLTNDWPRINEKTFKNAFKDHVGYSDSVCSHSREKSINPSILTIASAILNLSQRTLHLAKGPPCMTLYKYFKFDFSQL